MSGDGEAKTVTFLDIEQELVWIVFNELYWMLRKVLMTTFHAGSYNYITDAAGDWLPVTA